MRLAALVTEFIPRGTEVLLGQRPAGSAQPLIEATTSSTRSPSTIEERCYQVLALQQPMAGDLRASSPPSGSPAEIERSGDLMVNIAKGARRIYGAELDPAAAGPHRAHERGGASASSELAIDAYVEARRQPGRRRSTTWTTASTSSTATTSRPSSRAMPPGDLDLQAAVQLALIGRYYERIGDHAVNIGERVQYMVTGWLPEHTGAARLQPPGARRRDLAAEPSAAGDRASTVTPSPAAIAHRRRGCARRGA